MNSTFAKFKQHLPPAEFVDQAEQVVADHLDVLLVEDLLVDEVDDGDVADVFDFEPTTAGGLGRHASTSPPLRGNARGIRPGPRESTGRERILTQIIENHSGSAPTCQGGPIPFYQPDARPV